LIGSLVSIVNETKMPTRGLRKESENTIF